MVKLAFVSLLLALLPLASCTSSGPVEPPVAAEIHAATPRADGGVTVLYDARSDGGDMILALVDRTKPEVDVTSTVLADFGPEREYLFTRASLGEDAIHKRLELTAVIREANGTVLATCRVR